MSKQYLFRIQLLNKKDFNPLNIVAYYSGQIQLNAFNGEKFMPDYKKQVIYSNLSVPQGELYQQLPDYLQLEDKKKDIIDNARNILWKSVDFFEKRFDSQFARLFEVYAPWFCSPEEVKKLMNNYAAELTKSGMVADISIHKTNTADTSLFIAETGPKTELQQDYSCFLLCTLRPFENGVFQKKNREWNGQDKLIVWRQTWIDMLKKTVQNATADELVKKQWLDKLNIYPESNNNFKPKM